MATVWWTLSGKMVGLTSASQSTVHPLLVKSQARSSQEKPVSLILPGSLCLHLPLFLCILYLWQVPFAECLSPSLLPQAPRHLCWAQKQDVLCEMLDEHSQVKCLHWVPSETEFTKYQSVKSKVTSQNSLNMFREMKNHFLASKDHSSKCGIPCLKTQQTMARGTLQVP